MDYLLQGLNVKEAVRLAAEGEHSHNGLHGVDGIIPRAGDRILLKNQLRKSENGIWIAATTPWSRSPDCDTFDELNRAYCFVREGNVNAGTSWVQVLPQTAEGQDRAFVLFSIIEGGGGPPGPPGPGVPAGGHTGDILIKHSDDDYDSEWLAVPGITVPTYEYIQTLFNSHNVTPVGGVGVGRMAGLGATGLTYITPSSTGKLLATIAGFMWNTSAAGQMQMLMVVGSGDAPHNGDLFNSSNMLKVGALMQTIQGGAVASTPFSASDVIQLTVGLRYWYDLVMVPITTGTAAVGGVAVTVTEIP